MNDCCCRPEAIQNESELDAVLARPYPELIAMMRRLEGDIAILGIAGKMGITMGLAAVNAIREAGVKKTVYGVSRFSNPTAAETLEKAGIKPVRCDFLDRAAVAKLPRVPNVIFMAGRKFGTGGEEDLTWAMNTIAPAHVGEHFANSSIVVFSTGCVYPLVRLEQGGCSEDVPPNPVGEYSQSCLGRERTFAYFSRTQGTRVCLLRLNYALDLRYGVLHDIAQAVWDGRPVDQTVGWFNALWQGDANNQALLALQCCTAPATALNLTGPETASVAEVAHTFGRLMGKPVLFSGETGPVAYLNNAARAHRLFGYPRVALDTVIRWTADWVKAGGRSLGKPTHFEVSSGSF